MTKPDKTRQPELSQAQELAIERLLAGATDTEAAEAAGVARQTVNTWRNREPAFIAEINSRRLALWSSHQEKLRSLAGRSIEILEECLQKGDLKMRQAVALQILRGCGVLNEQPPTGETNAKTIAVKQAEQEADESERAVFASLGMGVFSE